MLLRRNGQVKAVRDKEYQYDIMGWEWQRLSPFSQIGVVFTTALSPVPLVTLSPAQLIPLQNEK
jgi:hypothetical protein